MGQVNDFTMIMNKIHGDLKDKFKADEDVAIAQELEDFLNYVIYGNGAWKAGQEGKLSELLTDELKNEFIADTDLRKLFTKRGGSATKIGERGEQAFAQAILKILDSDPKYKEQAGKAAASLLHSTDKIIIGKEQATIPLSDLTVNAIENSSRKGAVQTVKDQEYTRSYYKQGKIDIDMSRLEIVVDWTPGAKKLLGLTASVKNYQDFTIKLEQLNPQKAYLAVVSTIKEDLSKQTVAELYDYYYLQKKGNEDEEVTNHLQHLQYIYALTGYGQVYKSDFIQKQILSKYARFLMYNNPSQRKIIIKSTHDIVSKLISDSSEGTGFKTSGSGVVKYYLEH